jgi:putative DNA primase/helicase
MTLEAVRDALGSAEPVAVPKPAAMDDQAELARLASLPDLDYQRARADAAKALNVTIGFLDRDRKDRRKAASGDAKQGRSLVLEDPDPFPDPVPGEEVLTELAAAIRRHVILSEAQADAAALWVAGTWVGDLSFHAPRLAITSAEKGCGKTTCLDTLAVFLKRALPSGGISSAAVARIVEAAQPTLFIDEADTFLADNEDLRGVLNAGHRRGGQVVKCVGDDHEPRAFSVHCWAAIAAIGKLPGTLEDRAVKIELRRAKLGERPERLSPKVLSGLRIIASKVRRFVEDNAVRLADADPVLPDFLFGRAADNWRTLFALAQAAGGAWLDRVERAALALAGNPNEAAESIGGKVLADIRATFESRGVDRISSADLCAALAEREDRPWPEWSKGKPITPVQLARLLKPYMIVPNTIRLGATTAKGYALDAFEDAFERYLPPPVMEPPIDTSQRHKPQKSAENAGVSSVTAGAPVTHSANAKSAEIRPCDGVTGLGGGSASDGARVRRIAI